LRYWQRAYEGPYESAFIHEEIDSLLPYAANILGLEASPPRQSEIADAVQLLTLTHDSRTQIDLPYPGPHFVFLPFGEDRLFIDYAWIGRRLYDLFFGLRLKDQRFKGDILEEVVRASPTVLPSKPLTSQSGQQRQIDASFAIGDRLIIAECRVIGKSIAFDRGDLQATNFRKIKIREAFADIDEKARWLAANPRGRNYDSSGYHEILPVVISPFVEFPPDTTDRYRITDSISRTMTPEELAEHLLDGSLSGPAFNLVSLA
jgi:hypothetical protein